MSRPVAMALAVLLIASACGSSGGGSADPTARPPTSTAPLTPTTTVVSLPAQQVQVQTTTAPAAVATTGPGGRNAEDVFVTPAAPAITYLTLDDSTRARLDARFRQDERIDAVLNGVAARGVQRGDELAGVIVAVAVSPEVAGDPAFQEAFTAEATRDARAEAESMALGDQSLLTYETQSGLSSILWQYDNVFVLISGRDAQQVQDAAGVLVTTLVGPVGVPDDVDGDGLPEKDLTGDGVPDIDADGDGVADAAGAPPTTDQP